MGKELKYTMRVGQDDLDKLDVLCSAYNIDSRAAVILKLIRDEFDRITREE